MENKQIKFKNNEELRDWFFENMLCGCGCPDECVDLLHKALKGYKARTDSEWEDKSIENIVPVYGKQDNLFAWWFLYTLSNLEIIEHGCSVRGCWLTEFGEELLRALDTYGFAETN